MKHATVPTLFSIVAIGVFATGMYGHAASETDTATPDIPKPAATPPAPAAPKPPPAPRPTTTLPRPIVPVRREPQPDQRYPLPGVSDGSEADRRNIWKGAHQIVSAAPHQARAETRACGNPVLPSRPPLVLRRRQHGLRGTAGGGGTADRSFELPGAVVPAEIPDRARSVSRRPSLIRHIIRLAVWISGPIRVSP